MLYLYPNDINVIKARQIHVHNAICIVYKRLTGQNCNDPNCDICPRLRKSRQEFSQDIVDYLNRDKLKVVLAAEPEDLWLEQLNFFDSIGNYSENEFNEYVIALSESEADRSYEQNEVISKYKELNDKLQKIFSYEFFAKKSKHSYDAYELAANLDIRTCTYCNRQYTSTVISEKGIKLTRPQFDHWYPKTKFPFLALSFYNLIPSCSTCNGSIKRDEIFRTDSHLHPYLRFVDENDFKFSYEHSIKSRNGIKVKLIYPSDDIIVKRTMKSLKIEEIYNAHTDEIKDLIKLRKMYSDRYLSILSKNTYKGLKMGKEELYLLAFGTHFNEKNFSKRPLSKKKDLLKELGVID